ncbi:MAG: putative D,D-dipeptide transport system permease protein DdpC [Anaerolineales bacterium]|nr:putative D,D-dipeptide transport system permease protein DdpC [Anaerolineales bacterium]
MSVATGWVKDFQHRYKSQLESALYFWSYLRRNTLSVIGILVIFVFILVAAFGPYFAPYNPVKGETSDRLQGPSAEHWFGTDQLGRDIFSRVIHGARVSLRIAMIVAVIAGTVGTVVGVTSGYFGALVDDLLMRVTDMFFAFPKLVLAMAVAAALGPDLENVIFAIAIASWPVYARLARGEALAVREEDYIEAIRALGAGRMRILFLHVLPMCITPIIIQVTLDMGFIILTAAGLGFIGFGAQPPTPEWGIMIAEGRNFITSQWWLSTFPGLAILVTVLGFNLLGDGLRDVLDPRLTR